MMPNKRRQPRGRMGKVPTIHAPLTFEAGPGFVTAVVHIDEKSTVGIKFESPEQLLETFFHLLENAAMVWPDNEFIKYYLSSDD